MRQPAAFIVLLLLTLVIALPRAPAQIPDDDPAEAQARWYERENERPDLVKGAFEVLRFPTGWKFEPRYQHDPANRKRILNPDFWCNRCVREKRLVPPEGGRPDRRLMDRAEDQVLEAVARITRGVDFTYIEDEDFKLLFDLGPINLKLFRNPFLKEELLQLGDVFPEVSERTVDLDAHKRAHLYLVRAHRLLRDFWWLAGTSPEETKKKYPHLGPYMGMNNKQEVYVFERQMHFDTFSKQFIGRSTTDGQCWHLFNTRAMVMCMHGAGHQDPQTQNYYLHRITHNLFDAYRMYSFKLPAWLQMGAGHWVERRESIRWNTFCFSEGTMGQAVLQFLQDENWLPKIKKAVMENKVLPFVEGCTKQEYDDFEPHYHMYTYSWFCFLLRLGPEKFKTFLDIVKSKQPGETLYQIQLKAFREAYGITMLQFDEGWRAWVRKVYPDL